MQANQQQLPGTAVAGYPLDLTNRSGAYVAWGCTRAGGASNGRVAATTAYQADWRHQDRHLRFVSVRETEMHGVQLHDDVVDARRLIWVGVGSEGRWLSPAEFRDFAAVVTAFAKGLQ